MSAAPMAHSHARGFKGFFEEHRTLDTYPTGAYRLSLLVLTLLANVIIYFDVGFSGLLPLWMSSLHFSAKEFGGFLTFAVILSGLAGLVSGPLADRHGRVVVIDTCIVAQVILTFANLLMTNFWSFVLIRGLMFVAAGLAGPATFSLIRDLTPRLGRGSGFGLLGLGATASQWVWTFVPGITLSRLHTWQSQIWIMSFFGVVMLIPAILWLKDVHARFRLTVLETESSAAQVRKDVNLRTAEVPKTARAAFGALLNRWEIWVLVIGNVLIITVPITIQTFGPLMFVQSFKYKPAEASKIASYFFLAQALFYFPSGYLSDLLRLRKALSFVMSAVLAGVVAWWAFTFYHALSPVGLAIVCGLMGAFWDLGYVPWTAFYSEYLEDVMPALQATGWAFQHSVFRFWLASAGFLQPVVAQHYGWGAWVWFVAIGVVVYMISLVVVPGYWGRSTAGLRPAPAHA
jgi:MFS family permease